MVILDIVARPNHNEMIFNIFIRPSTGGLQFAILITPLNSFRLNLINPDFMNPDALCILFAGLPLR